MSFGSGATCLDRISVFVFEISNFIKFLFCDFFLFSSMIFLFEFNWFCIYSFVGSNLFSWRFSFPGDCYDSTASVNTVSFCIIDMSDKIVFDCFIIIFFKFIYAKAFQKNIVIWCILGLSIRPEVIGHLFFSFCTNIYNVLLQSRWYTSSTK